VTSPSSGTNKLVTVSGPGLLAIAAPHKLRRTAANMKYFLMRIVEFLHKN
jgi:hypothetical protein